MSGSKKLLWVIFAFQVIFIAISFFPMYVCTLGDGTTNNITLVEIIKLNDVDLSGVIEILGMYVVSIACAVPMAIMKGNKKSNFVWTFVLLLISFIMFIIALSLGTVPLNRNLISVANQMVTDIAITNICGIKALILFIPLILSIVGIVKTKNEK